MILQTILLVDDDETMARYYACIFEGKYRVVTASSGKHAVRISKHADDIHLVILEARLSDMSGLEVLREIKKNRPAVPVILVTAYGDEAVAVKAFRSGAKDYLRKPFAYNEMGIYYSDRHEYQKALEPILRSMQLDPFQPAIYINLGVAYEGLGLPEKAMDAYQRAILMNPNDSTAYYNLGLLTYKKNDRARALELIFQARDLNYFEPNLHKNLARIYHDMGRMDLARDELDRDAQLK